MAGNFTTQDVARVPAGWKVRTVKAGAHRVRVAFPPGRRQKGSGEVVQVLHPRGENPGCTAMKNPAELVLMGANPMNGKKAQLTPEETRSWEKAFEYYMGEGKSESQADRLAWKDIKAEFPRLKGYTGALPNPIPTQTRPLTKAEAKRKAKETQKLNDGRRFKVVRVVYTATGEQGWDIIPADTRQRRLNPMFNANFSDDEKLALGRLGIKWTMIQTAADVSKARKALREAAQIRRRFGNPSSAMPITEQREQAAEIYSGFHATPPENKLVMDEPHIPAGAYPELGLLYQLYFKPTNPGAVDHFEKVYTCEKENTHVIGTLDRDHIYFAGGDQELDHKTLAAFGWNGEDRFRLGTARKIVYLAQKYHDAVPKEGRGKLVEWIHEFGEESGVQPQLWYDHGNARLYLKHGEYEIRDEGIVN